MPISYNEPLIFTDVITYDNDAMHLQVAIQIPVSKKQFYKLQINTNEIVTV
jgi:hypothetical protein